MVRISNLCSIPAVCIGDSVTVLEVTNAETWAFFCFAFHNSPQTFCCSLLLQSAIKCSRTGSPRSPRDHSTLIDKHDFFSLSPSSWIIVFDMWSTFSDFLKMTLNPPLHYTALRWSRWVLSLQDLGAVSLKWMLPSGRPPMPLLEAACRHYIQLVTHFPSNVSTDVVNILFD